MHATRMDVDPRPRALALMAAMGRLTLSLTPQQADQIVTGAAKLALLFPGHQIVEPLVGLDSALVLLRGLSVEDRVDLTNNAATLTVVRARRKVQDPLDLDALAVEVRQLSSEDDVIKCLDADKRLTIALLKVLCVSLNLPVPTSRTRAALQRHIATELIGRAS
jgi:hypothetical protein